MSCAVRMQGINALGALRLDEGPTKDVLGLLLAVREPCLLAWLCKLWCARLWYAPLDSMHSQAAACLMP